MNNYKATNQQSTSCNHINDLKQMMSIFPMKSNYELSCHDKDNHYADGGERLAEMFHIKHIANLFRKYTLPKDEHIQDFILFLDTLDVITQSTIDYNDGYSLKEEYIAFIDDLNQKDNIINLSMGPRQLYLVAHHNYDNAKEQSKLCSVQFIQYKSMFQYKPVDFGGILDTFDIVHFEIQIKNGQLTCTPMYDAYLQALTNAERHNIIIQQQIQLVKNLADLANLIKTHYKDQEESINVKYHTTNRLGNDCLKILDVDDLLNPENNHKYQQQPIKIINFNTKKCYFEIEIH